MTPLPIVGGAAVARPPPTPAALLLPITEEVVVHQPARAAEETSPEEWSTAVGRSGRRHQRRILSSSGSSSAEEATPLPPRETPPPAQPPRDIASSGSRRRSSSDSNNNEAPASRQPGSGTTGSPTGRSTTPNTVSRVQLPSVSTGESGSTFYNRGGFSAYNVGGFSRNRRRNAPVIGATGEGIPAPSGQTAAPARSRRPTAPPRGPDTPGQRRPGASGQPPRRRGAIRPMVGEALLPERDLLIGMAQTAGSLRQLEEVATQIAAYLQGFRAERREARRDAGGRPGHRSGVQGRADREALRGSSERRDRPSFVGGPTRGDQVREATRIQRLFRLNRRRAVQEVLMGPSLHCQVSKDRVHEHFLNMYSPAGNLGVRPPPPSFEAPDEASSEALVKLFEVSEVDRRIRRMTNSAPGPDGLTYDDLKRADPGSHLLTSLFNLCLRLESVPSSWKTSNTVLVHKKGDRDDLSNWRPLAMSDTTPKLFAAVLADRLVKWSVFNRRLSPAQKGFLPCEGCYEHNFVLQEALVDARRRGRQVVVAWLDLSNAFGSVPHATIYRAFEESGVPSPLRNIVESMYGGCTTRVRTVDGFTDPVPILSGVRQGCPMSPVAFNLALEPVLRAATGTGVGYTLHGHRHTALAYADDLALVADTPAGMETLLKAVEAAASGIGLRFNPAKCATLHVRGRGPRGVHPTRFTLQGQVVHALAVGEPYEHLGVPTGFQVRQTPLLTIDELVRDLRAVDRSLLAPWQKIETVATFILPRLDFCLRGAHVEKRPLTAVDKIIRRMAKSWLNLPQRASAEVVYLPPSRGGCGLLPLADMADALTIAHTFRLLTADDAVVRELAWSSLREAVARKIGHAASEQELAEYLSGSLEGCFARDGGDISTLWSRARNAARRSANLLGLRWQWSLARAEMSVALRGSRDRETVVPPVARGQIIRRLRTAVVEFYHQRLQRKRDQGKVFGVSSRSGVSNHFLRGGNFTRFADWRFVHRARLDVLPLNGAIRWGGGDKRCRRCGAELESLPHVICHCRPHSAAWQLRHDAVVSRIAKACRLPGRVFVNKTVEGIDGDLGALRPDIVVRHEPSRSIVIVDVTVPFENEYVAFEEARARKILKYKPLADVLGGRGYRVAVSAIVVGALGSWDPANESALQLLRIGNKYASLMRRLIVSDTIRWSRDIYVEHVSGVRQYCAAPPESDPTPGSGPNENDLRDQPPPT